MVFCWGNRKITKTKLRMLNEKAITVNLKEIP